jgi:hypothetical protein
MLNSISYNKSDQQGHTEKKTYLESERREWNPCYLTKYEQTRRYS